MLATGLALWSKGSLMLPTRNPPAMMQLKGVSLALFGLSPVLAGLVLLRAALRVRSGQPALNPHSLRDPLTLTFLAACLSMILGLLLSQRV